MSRQRRLSVGRPSGRVSPPRPWRPPSRRRARPSARRASLRSRGVRRLQPHFAVRLPIKPLQGGFGAVHQSHHDLAIANAVGLLHQHVVPFDDVVIDHRPNSFKKALQIINEMGADIINVGRTAQQTGRQIYFFRLGACKTAAIKKTLENEGYEVLEAMD